MKIRKKCGIVLAALAILISSMGVVQAAESQQGKRDVLQARNGVVRVIYEERYSYYMGSAFGVGRAGEETDLFITCYHVVNPNDDPNETYESVYITTGASLYDETYQVNVLYADRDVDMAILQTERKVSGRIALPMIASSNIEATMQVYTLGYPGISDEFADITYYDGDFSSLVEDQTITTGTITRRSMISDGIDYFLIDADINHGNSGGPTVTEQGYVIGINEAIMADSDGGNYVGLVTHVDYVMEALDSLNISYDTISAEEFAREQEEDATEVMDQQNLETQTDSEKSSMTDRYMILLIVIVVAALILLLLFVIYMIYRDKRREAQIAKEREQYLSKRSIESYQSAQPVMGAPKVIGMQGLFANNSFTITGSLIMGRSRARCHLVYPQNTPGVSNVHCELRLVNGALYLMDHGSSYGTFVNGQKMPPNQPYQLHNGETFYLAAQQNSFIVRL